MDFNLVKGKLAFGNDGGYFFSNLVEGVIVLNGVSLDNTLKHPCFPDNRYNLGYMMRAHQLALLRSQKESDFPGDNLEFICSKIGSEIIKAEEFICGVMRPKSILSEFQMKLVLDLTDLRNGEFSHIERDYEAINVKAGYYGQFNNEFEIHYSLR